MKKIICIVLILCILPVVSLADNYSKMTYQELVNIQKVIALEIMSRPEWKQTKVPAGLWKVGEDIPAGTYSISADFAGVVVWKRAKDDYSDGGLYYNEVIKEGSPCGKIILEKGMLVENSSEVIFAPPMMLEF